MNNIKLVLSSPQVQLAEADLWKHHVGAIPTKLDACQAEDSCPVSLDIQVSNLVNDHLRID